jgi:hypothetical protein
VSSDVHINIYSIHREGTHNGFELDRLFGIKSDNTSSMVRLVRKLLIFKKKKNYKTISSLLLNMVVKITGIKLIQEKGYSRYNPEYIQPSDGFVLYFGFWQSPLYFDPFQAEIRKVFSFDKLKLSNQSQSLLGKIQTGESVSVHIRRGDFLSKEINNAICNEIYYKMAIDLIAAKLHNTLLVVFSDDLEWVKQNLSLSNAIYVDWNAGKNSWQDMYLMSQCKHNIIANSTFSWWGAWLNVNPDKIVIAPAQFMKQEETPDIYPANWITIN